MKAPVQRAAAERTSTASRAAAQRVPAKRPVARVPDAPERQAARAAAAAPAVMPAVMPAALAVAAAPAARSALPAAAVQSVRESRRRRRQAPAEAAPEAVPAAAAPVPAGEAAPAAPAAAEAVPPVAVVETPAASEISLPMPAGDLEAALPPEGVEVAPEALEIVPPSEAAAGVRDAAGATGATEAAAVEAPGAAVETESVVTAQAGAGEAAAPAPEVAAPETVAAPGPAAAAAGGPAVPLLMPEPPSELSAAGQKRLQRAQGGAGRAAAAEAELPSAAESTGEARGAVNEPPSETAGRAQGDLMDALDKRPAPSPEIEELCRRIRKVISEKRPADEDALVEAEPEEMAKEAGSQLEGSVEGGVDEVGGSYDELETPPEGAPEQVGEEMEMPPEGVATPEIGAAAAAPDEIPPEDVSLDADLEASQARMDEAGMTSEPAKLVQEGPVAEARAAQGELVETAERDPVEVLAEQHAAVERASGDMAALQEAALAALEESRRGTVAGTGGQQHEMVGSEEQTRESVSAEAQAIYGGARSQVQTLLEPLTKNAMERWASEKEVLASSFKQRLQRVADWIEERHGGTWGWAVSLVDSIAGLPVWVTLEYDAAEKEFGDGVCDLIREISTQVNSVVATCEAIIENARAKIATLFGSLPTELVEWAAGEQARLQGQLDTLQNEVTETRDGFTQDLAQRAGEAVDEVRREVQELRLAAGGLLGRIANAVNAFLDDPAKFIIEGLLSLLGISPASFWALVARIQQVIDDIADDPMGFADNLLEAIGKGFGQFFDNIADHLLEGLLDWLFSGLGSVGVTLPTDFSLKSVITFFLQLMGITWPRIRKLLAEHLGEENVALIEKSYELIATLIELGPEGIFELIKEKLDPQAILDMVLEAAVDYLIEAIINAVSVRILLLFNPVGAIIQAIEAVYRVLKWVFENAARIFSLIETIVGGIADIIAGNIGGMANAIEKALTKLIAPVIDFLAGYLGFGDLPDKIADVIRGMQNWIEGILDQVIGFLADQARALLKAVAGGRGTDEPVAEPSEPTARGPDTRPSVEIPFTMSGAAHTLTLDPDEGGDVDVLLASGRQLPAWKQFRAAHTALDNLRRYIDTIQDPDVVALYRQEFGMVLETLPVNLVDEFTKLYGRFFPKGREEDLSPEEKQRAGQKVGALMAQATDLVARITAWADDMGVDELTQAEIDTTVQKKGLSLWSRAWQDKKQRIEKIISGYSYKGAPVEIRGSVKKGLRGDPKARTRFDEDSFDVDMFVVDVAAFDEAERNGARVTFGKIFPQPRVPDLQELSDRVVQVLAAAFPHVARVADSDIVLRRVTPGG